MSWRQGKRLIPLALVVMLTVQAVPFKLPPAFAEKLPGKSPVAGFQSPSQNPGKKPAYVLQQLDESDADLPSSGAMKSKTLQGTVTNIHVTRGRSQIIKFAQRIPQLSIAEPTMADVIALSPDQIMINGRQPGVTSLIVWDENGQEGIFDLFIDNDTSELLDAVKEIAPNEKIKARITTDSLIISGQVSSSVILDEIRKTAAAYGYRDDKFVDLTDTPVPQVVLDVKIAETKRSIGRNLRSAFSYDRGDLSLTRLSQAVDSGLLAKVLFPITGQASLVGRTSSGIIPPRPLTSLMNASNVGGVTGALKVTNNLNYLWDILETSGRINILASPTLVCTHGRSADFLAGGEFPYRSGTDQSGQPVISFKEFGVKLKFTPWIAPKSGRIELKVEPEVSTKDSSTCVPGSGGDLVCGVATRRTSTTVDLMDGESLMISGILKRDEQNSFSKVPFIGNLPILGNFFKNADMSKEDQELVVVVTPRIIKPADYGKMLGSAH